MNNVWIIDDEESIRTICASALEDLFNVESFSSASEALLALNSTTPDLIITDIKMPGMSGLEFLDKVSEKFPNLPTIIITAHANIDNALSAYKGGAFEYLTKPFDINEIRKLAIKATKSSKPQHDELTQESNSQIVGKAESMQEVFKAIGKISKTDITVLIRGESGTGKELIAQSVHENSSRSNEPFIAINVAAIPHELLESELFGHEKGAFTGADKVRAGRFEQSSGGTLFLDEIGDMPLSLQSKLLRALENKTIQRVGGDKEIKIDLRLICATHQNIEKYIDEGKFRADLYFRINVFPIIVPSLAERIVDLQVIVEFMLNELKGDGESVPKFDQSAFQELGRYNWPGNIRELRNVVERAAVLFGDQKISGKNVQENLLRLKVPDPQVEKDEIWEATSQLSFENNEEEQNETNPPLPHPSHYMDWFLYFDNIDIRRHLIEVEEVLIKAAIEKNNGHITKASECLRLNRTTLIEKMKKLSIN
mgnify:CR=1 FL=1